MKYRVLGGLQQRGTLLKCIHSRHTIARCDADEVFALKASTVRSSDECRMDAVTVLGPLLQAFWWPSWEL